MTNIGELNDEALAALYRIVRQEVGRRGALKAQHSASLDLSTAENFANFCAEVSKQSSEVLEETLAAMQNNWLTIKDYSLMAQTIRKELRLRKYNGGAAPFKRRDWRARKLSEL